MADKFQIVAVGDSLVFGQGLREEFKFAEIAARRLETEFFGGKKSVGVERRARSGARLFLRESETEGLKRAGFDEFFPRHSEINVSFPSIEAQINFAENGENADLIFFSGGITEITVTGILNIFRREEHFHAEIEELFKVKVPKILSRAAEKFPNAPIIVCGYYQMISEFTPIFELFDAVCRLFSTPPYLRRIIGSPLNQIYLKRVGKKMSRRCEKWKKLSDEGFRKAVDDLNRELGRRRFFFVESPLTAQNAYAAPETLLWKLNENGICEDDFALERRKLCRSTFDDIFRRTGLKYRSSVCELAALGHPNRKGAKLYADAVYAAACAALEINLSQNQRKDLY